ncbi:hypothetical protein AN958_10707 [Leucoagaricus sp. SymC.cos]|nr:hypothetical protein AN958_10707 [Leucoagaricus sp. SymC.cos]
MSKSAMTWKCMVEKILEDERSSLRTLILAEDCMKKAETIGFEIAYDMMVAMDQAASSAYDSTSIDIIPV